MVKLTWIIYPLAAAISLIACGADVITVPPAIPSPGVTATPTALVVVTCADVDANWGQDWAAVLDSLANLIEAGQQCGDEPLLSKMYAAYFNEAASLENEGRVDEAIGQYRAALAIDAQRREALGALIRLNALPKPTPPTCLSSSAPRPDPALTAASDPARFVMVEQGRLRLEGEPFTIRGVNYYPRQAPWERFWSEADPAAMAEEFDAIRAAGINTLRVFLWYRPLFTCQPEDAIPNEAVFELVDSLLRLARGRDLKLIISLNDLPDLIYRPLYTDWDHYDARTTYIVRRYRNESALLAWDVRNGPDLDLSDTPDRFTHEDIMAWLAHITDLVREHDPHHLITTGWLDDPLPAAPYVDILAFQHWAGSDALAQRLVALKAESSRPLLLIAAGEHSWPHAPDSPQDEASQAAYLKEITAIAEANDAGWVIWTAFDFVPAPGRPDDPNFHFGLWRTDLTPKPVLDVLPLGP